MKVNTTAATLTAVTVTARPAHAARGDSGPSAEACRSDPFTGDGIERGESVGEPLPRSNCAVAGSRRQHASRSAIGGQKRGPACVGTVPWVIIVVRPDKQAIGSTRATELAANSRLHAPVTSDKAAPGLTLPSLHPRPRQPLAVSRPPPAGMPQALRQALSNDTVRTQSLRSFRWTADRGCSWAVVGWSGNRGLQAPAVQFDL